MLNPASIFSFAGLLAIVGWFCLILSLVMGNQRRRLIVAARFVVPGLLAGLYVLLLWNGRAAFEEGGFGSIAEVRRLFANDFALAAGWVHYLAFDLFVGSWIAADATNRKVLRILAVPCLALTFLLGPAGLLLYLALRPLFPHTKTEVSA